MDRSRSDPTHASFAESIRRVVVDAGVAAYEDAGIQGLCAEGRWEAAVAAMRAVALPRPRPAGRPAESTSGGESS